MEAPCCSKYSKSYNNSSNYSNYSNSNLDKPYKKVKNNLEFLVKEMELDDEILELKYKKELYNSIYYIIIIIIMVIFIILVI